MTPHKRNAPSAVAPARGENQNPTLKKENQLCL